GSEDQTARLWDARLGRPVGPPLPHQGAVTNVVFAADGRTLLSCGKDGKGRLWPAPAGVEAPAGRVLLWTERLAGKKLDSGGAVRFLGVQQWREHRQALRGEGP